MHCIMLFHHYMEGDIFDYAIKIGWVPAMIGWACAQPFSSLAMPLVILGSNFLKCVHVFSYNICIAASVYMYAYIGSVFGEITYVYESWVFIG